MAKIRAVEVGVPAPPVLDKLREELEGLSSRGGVIARRTSALKRVRSIRNAHIAQCGNIFFTTTYFGKVIFLPHAGRKLLGIIFLLAE